MITTEPCADQQDAGQPSHTTATASDNFRRPGSCPEPEAFSGIVGRSASFERLLTQMHCAAPHLRVAAIEGEPGTGKSLVAEQLRLHGPFKAGSLVAVRASDLNESTGPDDNLKKWRSLCQSAHHGMLLLEGIHELSPDWQTTVLEYLRSEDVSHSSYHSVAPGPTDPDVPHPDSMHPDTKYPGTGHVNTMQLVVTSALSLRGLVGAGSFSRELAFRLTAMRFVLPPLRERRDDISLLADSFIEKYAAKYGKTIRGLHPDALTRLLNHKWPGNVRELESVIEAACLEVEVQWIRPIDIRLTPGGPSVLQAEVLGPSNQASQAPHAPAVKSPEDLTLDAAISRHIADILARTHGNKLRTARLLGISRSTLYRMLQGGQTI